MVEQVGHRVTARGLDEGHRLPGDAALGRAEDEEEEDGHDRRRGERGEDDVHACPIQALDDRRGVAGDQDGAKRALVAGRRDRGQRKVLTDDVRTDVRGRPVSCGLVEHRVGLTGEDFGDGSSVGMRAGTPLGAAEENAVRDG